MQKDNKTKNFDIQFNDIINFNTKLNPLFFDKNNKLKQDIKKSLFKIYNMFVLQLLQIEDIKPIEIQDLRFLGSNAQYTYTKFSDIDLHVVIDLNKLSDNQDQKKLLDKLLKNSGSLFNVNHNITIKGRQVQIYVQDKNESGVFNGVYSIMQDKWLVKPKIVNQKDIPKIDKPQIIKKYKQLIRQFKLIKHDLNKLLQFRQKIKKTRQSALRISKNQYCQQNYLFKLLRNTGFLKQLKETIDSLKDKDLSLENKQQ